MFSGCIHGQMFDEDDVLIRIELNVILSLCTAEMEDQVSVSGNKEPCITEQTQFFFETNASSFEGSVGCDNCSM